MAGTTELADLFREADDDWLAALLADRPDLARPVPQSLTALASRAGSRASASRALATSTAPEVTVLEAVVTLTASGGTTTLAALADALGGAAVAPVVERLRTRALLLGDDETLAAAPGVREAVGPTPLGLGPPLRALDVRADAGWPTTPSALRTVLADAPEGARRLLDALTWGPPVGTLGTELPPAARWLLDRHVLHRPNATEVVLPREVALAARGGLLARGLPVAPEISDAPLRRPDVVAAEVVAAAETVLRQLATLLDLWGEEPPAVLRGGGVAARDVKRLAALLEVSTTHAALVCELAGMLGLVGHVHDEEGSRWAPTSAVDGWLDRSAPERWAELAAVWLRSSRVPWLAGTRTDRGALRAALDPELHRTWAAGLRQRCLRAVAAWPEGGAPSVAQVRGHLTWQTPRSVPPESTVAAVLAEASALGLLGADALGPPTRLLLDGAPTTEVAAALAALFPPEVGELVIQGDLTGIVPGRPTAELAALLDRAADVDSRGAALTVRFTADSLGRAITSGMTAEELLERLRAVSRAPLPQPLEYLVADVARRQRRVRVQPASAVLRTDDEAATLALLAEPTLADLGLRRLSATVLAADVGPVTLYEALRRTGAAPLLEGPDGSPVAMATRRTRAVRPVPLEGPPVESPVDTAAAVAAMRAGEERAAALLAGTAEAPSAADELEMLRTAAARGAHVRIVIAGEAGATQERLVRPLAVDGGRVRVLDTAREAELTVATHRIVSVSPA